MSRCSSMLASTEPAFANSAQCRPQGQESQPNSKSYSALQLRRGGFRHFS
jgi:hypothetical protein